MVLNNQNGSTFLTVLIAAAIIPFGMIMYSTLTSTHLRGERRVSVIVAATILRSNLQAIVDSDPAWQFTIEDESCNPTLACIKNGTDCGASGDLREVRCVYNAQNQLVYSASDNTLGFNFAGTSCNVGSPDCIFRPIVGWKTSCTASPCIGQPYQVVVNIEYIGDDHLPLNGGRFYARSIKQ